MPIKITPITEIAAVASAITEISLNGQVQGIPGIHLDVVSDIVSTDQNNRPTHVKGNFWEKKFALNKQGELDIKFNFHYVAFRQFLDDAGYCQMMTPNHEGPASYDFVQITNHVVRSVDDTEIVNSIYKWIRDNNLPEVEEYLIRGSSRYFNKTILRSVPAKHIKFMKDTPDSAHLFFKNCFVKIQYDNKTENATPTTHNYAELKGHIWSSQIIERDYAFDGDYMTGHFAEFLQLAINKPHGPDLEEGRLVKTNYNTRYKMVSDTEMSEELKKLGSIMSGIGYMQHGYKAPSNAKLFALFDAKYSREMKALGRSGKSLIFKAIQQMVPTLFIDGKDVNFNKEKETFKQVTRATRVIVFNDVKPTFDFQNLFHKITEGITFERKFENPVTLSYEDSPKFGLTANFALKGNDDSSLDRQFIGELEDHFNAKNKPVNHFKAEFFTAHWPAEQWNKFYSFMIDCLRVWLEYQFIEFPNLNYFFKQLSQTVTPEFLDFWEETIPKDGQKFGIKEHWEKFKGEYADFEKLTQNKFTSWIKTTAKYYGYLYNPYNANGRIRSDGVDYAQLILVADAEKERVVNEGG